MKGDAKMERNKFVVMVILGIFMAFSLWGCAEIKTMKPAPTVHVEPAKVPISADIFKTPIVFTGTGWKPGEIVALEMVIPKEVKIPQLKPGEDAGVGFAKTDENGNFKCQMEGMTKIITIFRGSVNPETFQPIGETFNPIPFGKYTIKASDMENKRKAITTLEFIQPEPVQKK
jgi:hypothetical protein